MAKKINEKAGRQPLKIVIVGHVDHGKSTLVGRLLHDTNSLPEGRMEAIKDVCAKRGMPFEWAFLLDALQAERDQGITIDTSRIWFSSKARDYVIIDAPGHREFIRNMVTGAAGSDAAVLVIDAEEGVRQQTRQHGLLLHLLGIRKVVAVINKMDLVDYRQARFAEIKAELGDYFVKLGIEASAVIPVSGREGVNIMESSGLTAWYQGPSVMAALDAFPDPIEPTDLPLRLPVQDVYKFDKRRIIAGRIESGMLRVGDVIRFSPSGKTVRVATLENWSEPAAAVAAVAGKSVGITLSEQIFVERGQVASHVERPPIEANEFKARLFWLGNNPLEAGNRYTMKLNASEYPVAVKAVERIIDADNLTAVDGSSVAKNGVAEVVLHSRGLMAVDLFQDNPRAGRFVLADGYNLAGGGIITEAKPLSHAKDIKSTNIFSVEHRMEPKERWVGNGHSSGIIWLTGLSGSGKSTLAMELERQLNRKGYNAYVLDGDNIRSGLNSDLGFSHKDRAENIRRIGAVAALFADAGFIAITAFISPYRADRQLARAMRPDAFHEVYVKADLNICEQRDPKGLYKKARAGQIADFTGISAPYEEPEDTALVLDTGRQTIDESLGMLLNYVQTNFALPKTIARHRS